MTNLSKSCFKLSTMSSVKMLKNDDVVLSNHTDTQHNPPIENHTINHFGYTLIFTKCFQMFPSFENSIQFFWKPFPLFGNGIQFLWKRFLSFGNAFYLNWIQYPNNGNSFRFNWIQGRMAAKMPGASTSILSPTKKRVRQISWS